MEFLLIFIGICLLLGLVSNPHSNRDQMREDKLPPDFFKNYYNNNKE